MTLQAYIITTNHNSKQKLSHDPNNTRWTRDETSFGHKIMASQGWTPGSLLGAKDAPHAIHHTAANASHIRVVLKDNTLGLGAKSGSGLAEGECTGLDVFQTLLGRLNGNEDEVVAELKSKEELKKAIYSERKWGTIRFVKGGVLVGDKIQDLIDGEKERLKELEENAIAANDSSDGSSSSSDNEEEVIETKRAKLSKSDKLKDSKKRKAVEISEDEGESESAATDTKPKKKKSTDPARIARKAERAAKREAKEIKKAKKAEKERRKSAKGVESISLPTSAISTPPTSRPGTPHGIHAIRSRNILQKRMAVMDTAALNQVCSINLLRLLLVGTNTNGWQIFMIKS